jgi:hypothetical protein
MTERRVRILNVVEVPTGWKRTGRVIAENDQTVAVKIDDCDIPMLVRKQFVRKELFGES